MTFEQFLALISSTPAIGRRPNDEQVACIDASPTLPTMIVAGPGSGKTTVLVLRALRHMLVDGVPPERILITTFTKKAAREIRSRLIEWGEALIDQVEAHRDLAPDDAAFFRQLDVNRVVTGTLDSICQEALSSDRHADEPPLVTLETFAANVILQRRGQIGRVFRENGNELGTYLSAFTMDGNSPNSVGQAAATLVPIVERFIQDRVDVAAYGANNQPLAQQLIATIASDYRTYLRDNNLLDFSSLEEAMLSRLQLRRLPALLKDVSVVLVDEYQDTNALQEAIYFELVLATGASFTVVGDDDQSLYRFRGATIELFRAFVSRCEARLGTRPQGPLYLIQNYRSTPEIIRFFNAFVRNDPQFAAARIQPPKPIIEANKPDSQLPVLAMFRDNAEMLANDLTGFLHDVFRGNGFHDPDGRYQDSLRRNIAGGDLGDAVLLGSSVLEMQRPYFGNAPKPRFAHHLRGAMHNRNLLMFNPRGRSLRDIVQVEQLLGLTILAIDPPDRQEGHLFEGMLLTLEAKFFMHRWVASARSLLATAPPRIYGRVLQQEVTSWTNFVLGQPSEKSTGRDWPLLDVIYGFVPWIPHFEDDPEGQVYLEAISRAAGQAAGFSAYGGRIVRPMDPDEQNDHGRLSVMSVLRDVIAPIAENVIEVDEEIMPSVPRDRLNVMTIHQAKGLEYPLVIVDVGADFSTDASKNRFRRFPDTPSPTAQIEDALAPFTPELGRLRTERSGLERSFEDLIRLYYVAFSRPQSALMLVGCNKMIRWKSTIKHVASGWRQDESWAWREATPASGGRRAPAIVSPPAILFI